MNAISFLIDNAKILCQMRVKYCKRTDSTKKAFSKDLVAVDSLLMLKMSVFLLSTLCQFYQIKTVIRLLIIVVFKKMSRNTDSTHRKNVIFYIKKQQPPRRFELFQYIFLKSFCVIFLVLLKMASFQVEVL